MMRDFLKATEENVKKKTSKTKSESNLLSGRGTAIWRTNEVLYHFVSEITFFFFLTSSVKFLNFFFK